MKQISPIGLFLIFIFLFLNTSNVSAEACTSNGTGGGNWNLTTTWVQPACNGIPNATDDDVVIVSGDTVTLSVGAGNRQVRDITIDAGGTLDFTDGTLRVSHDITVNGTFNAASIASTALNSFAGGNKTLSGTGTIQFGGLNVTTNQLIVSPNVVANVSGLMNVATSVSADATSTFVFNGAGAQTLQLDTGAFDIIQFGNVTVNAGTNLSVTGGTTQGYRIAGDLLVNGSWDSTTTSINFNTTSVKNIDGTGTLDFGNLNNQQGNIVHTANTTISVLGDVNITNWTSTDATSLLVFDGSGTSNIIWNGNPSFPHYQLGSLTVTNSTILVLPNNADTRMNGNLTVDAGSALNANGSLLAFNEFAAGNKLISGTGSINLTDVSFTSNTTTLSAGSQLTIMGDVAFAANFGSADTGSIVFSAASHNISGSAASAQLGFVEIPVGGTVTSSMTNPFDLQISSHFLVVGNYTADANTTVIFNAAGTQNLNVTGSAAFTDVEVSAGTTLEELVVADNSTVSGTILNNGRINKAAKAVASPVTIRFGLASGDLPGVTPSLDVTAVDAVGDITVSWVGGNHPNADVPQQTGGYWEITETGDFTSTLNLPHNNLTSPSVCQYTGSGIVWNCAADSSTTDSVTRIAIADLDVPTQIWTVGADASADLELTKTVALTNDVAGDSNNDAGDSMTYTVTITNLSSRDVVGIVVNDVLPAGVTLDSFIASAGSYDAGTGVWDGFGLTSGTSATLDIVVIIDAGTEGQTISNTASIGISSLPDPVAGNNSDSAGFTVYNPVVETPVVAIGVFDPAISKIGFLLVGQVGVQDEQIEWIITVSNVGSNPGVNISVSDAIDSRLSINNVVAPGGIVTVNGQQVTVSYGLLNVGESVQFSIFTTVLEGEVIENTACVAADNIATQECASGSMVGQLPATGETPFWRVGILLGALTAGLGYWIRKIF